MWRAPLLLTISLIVTATSFLKVEGLVSAYGERDAAEKEVLYLPNGDGLEFLSLGYRNLLSDVLWFNTINYFGKHFKSDQDYQWLSHMCRLVTRLDPDAHYAFEFCSTMLGWEANMPEASIEILNTAIKHHPDNWLYYYLRGFNYFYFLNETEKAQEDFVRAAKYPEAPVVVERLAAKKIAMSDPNTAIEFLVGRLKMASDANEIRALEGRLKEVVYERDARLLETAARMYKEGSGVWPESLEWMKAKGLFRGNLSDPFGGVYQLNPNTGQVKSSTGYERMQSQGESNG